MKRPIEKLARLLAAESGDATIGQIAEKYGEEVSRVMDAGAVLKILEHFGAVDDAPISYIEGVTRDAR